MVAIEREQQLIIAALHLRIGLLSEVLRYAGKEMLHRPDLFVHTRRTSRLVTALGYQLNNTGKYDFDLLKLRRMGLFHDDAEFLTGDVIAPLKRSLSADELTALKSRENEGVKAIAHLIYGFRTKEEEKQYLSEQEEADAKQTPAAQLLDVADKWDALGEIIHDIRCGNEDFTTLLPFSQRTFQKFHAYPFWEDLGDHPDLNFNEVSTERFIECIAKARRLTIDQLSEPKSVQDTLHAGYLPDWPMAYRTWADVSRQTFYLNPEKYVFPGWYLELWRRWKYTPNGSSTLSGIIFP